MWLWWLRGRNPAPRPLRASGPTVGNPSLSAGLACFMLMFCERCEVASAERLCWSCGKKMRIASGADLKWASSHTYRRDRQYVGSVKAPIPIEDPEPASII